MKFERAAFAAGLGLFLWLLHRIGLAAIGRNLARVGWGFAAVLAVEGVVVLLVTFGWRWTLPRDRRVPFLSLVGMRMAGDGINALAPAAVVGGEIVHARLLARVIPAVEAVGSVTLAALAQFLAQILFIGLGAIIARAGTLQPRLRLLGMTLLAFLIAFVAILEWLSRRREAPPGRVSRFLDRIARLVSRRAPGAVFWRDLDRHVFGAMRERPFALALAVAFYLGAWLMNAVEIGLILALLGAPVPAATTFAIAVLTVLVEGVFFFVPARVGALEGGLYAVFLALRLDPATGFSLALVRRLRELTWSLGGLAILGLSRRSSAETTRNLEAPVPRERGTG